MSYINLKLLNFEHMQTKNWEKNLCFKFVSNEKV